MKSKMNFIGGSRVYACDHAVEQMAKRGRMSIEKARSLIVGKFKRSRLFVLKKNGIEIRHEMVGAANQRMKFVAKFENGKYEIITCWVQGRKRDFWKVG